MRIIHEQRCTPYGSIIAARSRRCAPGYKLLCCFSRPAIPRGHHWIHIYTVRGARADSVTLDRSLISPLADVRASARAYMYFHRLCRILRINSARGETALGREVAVRVPRAEAPFVLQYFLSYKRESCSVSWRGQVCLEMLNYWKIEIATVSWI